MGWVTRRDPATGRMYWANKATGESSWTNPSATALPAATESSGAIRRTVAAASRHAAVESSGIMRRSDLGRAADDLDDMGAAAAAVEARHLSELSELGESAERAARLLAGARQRRPPATTSGNQHLCTCGAETSRGARGGTEQRRGAGHGQQRAVAMAAVVLAGAMLWPLCSWRTRLCYALLAGCFVSLRFYRDCAFRALVLACGAFMLELDALPTSPRTSTILLVGSAAMLFARMLPVWVEWRG